NESLVAHTITSTGGPASRCTHYASLHDALPICPLESTTGSTGTIYYTNSIMLYENSPDQASSEALAAWWATQTDEFWLQDVMIDLPVTERLAADEKIASNPNTVIAIKEWQPLGQ